MGLNINVDALVSGMPALHQHVIMSSGGNPHSMFIVGVLTLTLRYSLHDAGMGAELVRRAADTGHLPSAFVCSATWPRPPSTSAWQSKVVSRCPNQLHERRDRGLSCGLFCCLFFPSRLCAAPPIFDVSCCSKQ